MITVGISEVTTPAGQCDRRGLEADFIWEDQKPIVEVDGYAYHSSRRAFDRDHQRDAILGDAGYRVLRITWRQIVDEPEKALTRIVRALGA